MTTELVPFHFEGDVLEVASEAGQIWISVKRICEILGIDPKSQQEKLKKKPWATVGFIPLVAQDSRTRDVFCIHLDSLPMWLAGIELARVQGEVKSKLELYQRKCAQVLRDSFLKPQALESHSVKESKEPLDLLIHQMQGLLVVAQELKQQEHRISSVEKAVLEIRTQQEEAQEDLLQLDRAEQKPLEKTTRAKLNELVRTYCYATRLSHSVVWNKLYRELHYRYHFDAKQRAKNKNLAPLVLIEEAGLLEALFAIASEELVLPGSQSSLRSFSQPVNPLVLEPTRGER